MTLFIGEKPSIAEALARTLSNNNYQKQQSRATPIYEFTFNNVQCKSTSVAGHLFGIGFGAEYQPWGTREELLLGDGHVIYENCKGAQNILNQLKQLSQSSQRIILALDADREGENICFEIINYLKLSLNKIFRLRFSALTKEELQRALQKLDKPDRNLSDSVEVRQELDLKIGVAFTRFQTKFLNDKYANLNTQTISYGPCQTPTLNFCVERHEQILHFKPQKMYGIRVYFKDFQVQYNEEWLDRTKAEDLEKLLKNQLAQVVKQSKKSQKSSRPVGLNTVQMLKTASAKLHISPADTMHRAEQLYMDGLITYPRTESTTYPVGFDFKEIISQLQNSNQFGQYADQITKFNPRKGVDAGDHPPITPTASHADNPDALYTLVARAFLASLLPDAEYEVTDSVIQIGDFQFHCSYKRYVDEGWHKVYKTNNHSDEEMGQSGTELQLNQKLQIQSIQIAERLTRPPGYLSESDLLGLMERNQIGTDASMAQHIQNICDRNYVKLGQNRTLVPTVLGVQLIQGLKLIDADLVSSQLRANMERDMTKVAEGKTRKEDMLKQQLEKYRVKFDYFKQNINLLDQLFEAKFESVKQAGKPFIRCQQCYKFTRVITKTPQRIYCNTCDRIYQVVQNGKLVELNGKSCQICSSPLIVSVISGQDKHSIFCPKCYTDGIKTNDLEEKLEKNLTCNQCTNKECEFSLVKKYIGECPECGGEEFDQKIRTVKKSEKVEIKQETKEKDDEILITFDDDDDCINITIDDNAQNKKPINNRQNVTNCIMKSKLYLDNVSMQSAQVQCSSCQFICNLPQGKADVAEEFCDNCGHLKITLTTQQGTQTQCCFCEMEDAVILHSKNVHDDYRRYKGNKQPFQKQGGKFRGKPKGRK